MSKLASKLGLLLLATALSLVLVELLCRLLLPDWAPPRAQNISFWQYDAVLGWAHQPSREGSFVHKDFSTRVTINSRGLRDREYSLARPEGKKRVLLLGDSFGWGYGVEQDETLDAVIEARHADLEMINASVAGYGTDQQLLYLKHSGLAFEPDLVLLLLHPNDVSNNTHSKQYDYEKPIFEKTGDSLVLRNNPVPHRLRGQLRRWALNKTYFPRNLVLTAGKYSQPEVKPAKSLEEGLDLTEALLLEMRRMASARGVDLWVVGVPWNNGEPRKIARHFRDFANEQGIRYVDLEGAFEQATGQTMYSHTQHWTAYGQALAAEVVEKELLEILPKTTVTAPPHWLAPPLPARSALYPLASTP